MRSDVVLPFEVLADILPEEYYEKVLRYCIGYTIPFPKRKVLPILIRKDALDLKKQGVSKPAIVEALMYRYDKNKKYVYQVLKGVV